jgi:outer membrane lipoprotein-sorting protein
MRTSRRILVAALFAALVQIPAVSYGAPSAQSVMNGMIQAQNKMRTFRARQIMKGTSIIGGSGSQVVDYALQKPNKVRIEMRQSAGAKPMRIIVCDGKKMWIYDGQGNQYMSQVQPKSIDMFLPNGGAVGAASLSKAAKAATYAGTAKVGGVDTNIVQFTQAGKQVKVWIGAKDSMIYRIVADSTDAERKMLEQIMKRSKKPMPKLKGRSVTTIEFSNVQVDKPLPASLFTFRPPAGAKELKVPAAHTAPAPRKR